MRSLDLVLAQAGLERGTQLQHFDGLDAKAGILLGFSGAIAALAPSNHVVVGLGRLAAVAAGISALWTFWPRALQVTNVFALRDKYLLAEPRFTKLALLDSQIAMVQATADLLKQKALRLKISMIALAVAVVLVAVGVPVH